MKETIIINTLLLILFILKYFFNIHHSHKMFLFHKYLENIFNSFFMQIQVPINIKTLLKIFFTRLSVS